MNTASTRWVVMKFGGTSVSSAERWQTIFEQVRHHRESGRSVVVVVSALSGVTNLLTELAQCPPPDRREAIFDEIDNRHRALIDAMSLEPDEEFTGAWNSFAALCSQIEQPLDAMAAAELLSFGERFSSAIGKVRLSSLGCVLQDARRWLQIEEPAGSSRDRKFLSSRCGSHADPEVADGLGAQGAVHITQGFIASDAEGRTCLLGRGGSDSSAAYFAARIGAEVLEIWTDVPGMFSADPRLVPDARLLRMLSYSEAQELASMGAKVLHPPSVMPARVQGIPVWIRDTTRPEQAGTRIERRADESDARVKGVVSRRNIQLIEMDNPSMWRRPGFLADVFAVFKEHGMSVDLVSTSESTVTVTLDPDSGANEAELSEFLEQLSALARVQLQTHCVSISLVGNGIRTILGQIAGALEVFQDRQVHMVTQSANDLNLTLVVDEEYADQLVQKLHNLLITASADQRDDLGPSWLALTRPARTDAADTPWWRDRAEQLQDLMEGRSSAFVYHLDEARRAARRLAGLKSLQRVLYSIKANHHPALLRALAEEGLGFECVSMNEVRHVLDSVPGLAARDVLFTPNFAPREEYAQAIDAGVMLTIDSLHPIRAWQGLFEGRKVMLRVDLETGYGHHQKVVTSGAASKFGIPIEHLDEAVSTLAGSGAIVVGLHTHSGSGVTHAGAWREQLQRFVPLLTQMPDVTILDLGGGLAVPERPGQGAMDLDQLDAELAELLGELGAERSVGLWMEPGRYLSAEAGVLLSRVTQVKSKGDFNYVGLATGMNSLIRPALYGAYHHIVNLSRLDEAPARRYRVVGPICESGDVLGESRLLPECAEGDLMLIANAGAYGRVMSSSYNMRQPAEELVL
jgi:diaminopimelate decarboxylase/aspartate kinase